MATSMEAPMWSRPSNEAVKVTYTTPDDSYRQFAGRHAGSMPHVPSHNSELWCDFLELFWCRLVVIAFHLDCNSRHFPHIMQWTAALLHPSELLPIATRGRIGVWNDRWSVTPIFPTAHCDNNTVGCLGLLSPCNTYGHIKPATYFVTMHIQGNFMATS